MEALIFIVVILLFMGVCLYAIVMPKYMVKRGRKVDVRVIACEEKYIEDPDTKERGVFYNVTVDFYGLYGETIVKSFQSETPYSEGEVIRSRYLDKKGLLWPGADAEAKEGPDRGIWLVIGFLVALLALILFVTLGRDENGNLPDWFAMGFGYFISVLFIVIGVWGIYKQMLIKRNESNMQKLSGVVADYVIDHGSGDDPDSYFPIYEYEWLGEVKRFKGRTGGNGKKYRTIGRKVIILRDASTGKVCCKEDEAGQSWFFAIFLLFGVLAFVGMLFGGFSDANENQSEEKQSTVQEQGSSSGESGELTEAKSGATPAWELYYLYTEDVEKCSFMIDIYDDASAKVVLFPNVTVAGKSIDQTIYFSLSVSDMLKIGEWIETQDLSAMEITSMSGAGEAWITLYLYNSDSEEKYGGSGAPTEGMYGEAYGLMKEVVPSKVFKEIQEREEQYYR